MVNEWNKSAFDTMLRRRLRSGAAPVAACAGFDLDAASAYLEGALAGSHRANYEAHLAGCVTCRRHLIELSRLAQCAPLAQTQPAAAPDRLSAWARWKDAATAWLDLPSWNLKWQIAGATGAAFAILIAVLGGQSLRQAFKRPDAAIAGQSAPSNLASQAQMEPLPTPSVEVLPVNAGESASAYGNQDSIALHRAPLQVPAPMPPVLPQSSGTNVSVGVSTGELALNANLPGEAPVAPSPKPTPAASEGWHNPPRLEASAATDITSDRTRSVLSRYRNDSTEELAAKDPFYVIRRSPPPELNPMKSESPKPNPRRRGIGFMPEQKAAPTPEPGSKSSDKSSSWLKDARALIARRNPFKWPFNSDSEQKPAQESDESVDNPLTWRFRGKVFVNDKGMWIDQEYKPEMQQWRRWTLTPNSEQYKRVLADEPLLKEFFDHGPILIVWKNQIYKLMKPERRR
jgi:hypothetical protein